MWLAAGLLALATLAVYWPATHCDFINCDDDVYLTANPRLLLGLTWENVQWYFSHFYFSNWHPVTSLSYLLDYELWGLKPFGFHLTNILFHALNTALVFLVLWELMEGGGWRMEDERGRMENRMWACALVAAWFGLHPLHVESVAWVAERKDVLSGCFGLLTLWAYARYARRGGEEEDGGWKREDGKIAIHNPQSSVLNGHRGYYWLALAFFALGLMSKPMLVTWPCVLLLLDYWPLNRVRSADCGVRMGDAGTGGAAAPLYQLSEQLTIWRRLLVEKIPFFALAAASCVVTYLAQHQGGALIMTDAYPLEVRIGNALVAYCRYVGKTFWPADLAIFYPHPGEWPMMQVLLAAVLLGVISWWGWRQRRHQPFLLTGWLWFLGTLVPVIGLVQAGEQAMADRYMYLPLLGIFIAVAWGAFELTARLRRRNVFLALAGVAVIALCALLTWRQLGHWRNSESIFRQALAATKDNAPANTDLGVELVRLGRSQEAIPFLEAAARLKPAAAEARNNLGVAYLNVGRAEDAEAQSREAVRLKPGYVPARMNLAGALLRLGRTDEAIAQYQEALQAQPDNAGIHNNLGVALVQAGRLTEAIEHYAQAIQTDPGNANAHFNLGAAFYKAGRLPEAIGEFQESARFKPGDAESEARIKLATELQRNIAEATNNPGLLNNVAWELATSPSEAVRSGGLAVSLAERACDLTQRRVTVMLGTLAAAYAEAGRFDDAVATAEKACALAKEHGEAELLKRNEELRELYQQHQPYREKR